jgi:hypothetical protein
MQHISSELTFQYLCKSQHVPAELATFGVACELTLTLRR